MALWKLVADKTKTESSIEGGREMWSGWGSGAGDDLFIDMTMVGPTEKRSNS